MKAKVRTQRFIAWLLGEAFYLLVLDLSWSWLIPSVFPGWVRQGVLPASLSFGQLLALDVLLSLLLAIPPMWHAATQAIVPTPPKTSLELLECFFAMSDAEQAQLLELAGDPVREICRKIRTQVQGGISVKQAYLSVLAQSTIRSWGKEAPESLLGSMR